MMASLSAHAKSDENTDLELCQMSMEFESSRRAIQEIMTPPSARGLQSASAPQQALAPAKGKKVYALKNSKRRKIHQLEKLKVLPKILEGDEDEEDEEEENW